MGPVIEVTPVVASDCVRADPISLKLELTAEDEMVVFGTNAACGSE
jgi:hypothetical protein